MDLLKQIWNTVIKFYFKEFLEYLQKHNSDAVIAVIFVACAVYYSREEYLQNHNSDAAIALIFVAFAVYYSREELYSQGRFRWRNLGLEFSWTLLGLGLLIECVILVLHYIAGFFPWGEFIWYTCCILIGFVLGVFNIANCIKVNFLRESPSPVDRSKKENERSSRCQSDASDTSNRDIRDIIILHTEDPRKEVYNFKNHLQSVITLSDFRVDVINEIGPGLGKLSIMDHVFMNYRLVFLYLSEDFKEDRIAVFNSELSIVENLTKWAKLGRVIPIWPSKIIKNNKNFPAFLEIITGIQYYDYFDEQYKSSYIETINRLVSNGREKYLKD